MIKFGTMVAATAILISQHAAAKALETDPFEMELEQLLNITVEGPSKFAQSVAQAPAVLSVITRKDIDSFGANSLLEILDRATSINMTGSFFFMQNVASVRGHYQSHSDNHVMILLNGRPMRESFTGGENFSIYTAFPIDIIKQIEIIRGPGSVLYGSSAYLAVFNIITLAPQNTPDKINVKIGSFATKDINLSSGYITEDLSLTFGARYFEENGWRFEAFDNNGVLGRFDAREQNHSMVLSGQYRDFNFNASLSKSIQGFWGSTSTFAASDIEQQNRSISSNRAMLDIGHHNSLSDRSYLNTNISYGHAHFSHYNYDSQSNNLFAETTYHLEASEHTRWMIGATAWHQDVSSSAGLRAAPVPPFSQTWWTLYAQLNYKSSEHLDWTVGAQVNKIPDVAANTVPRIGLNYQFDQASGIKVGYGQAFRAAYGVETNFNLVLCCRADGSNSGGLRGNPALKPETITTTDLQYYIARRQLQFKGTLFYSQQEDLIERQRASDNVLDFVNRGTLDSKGIELEFNYQFDSDLKLTAAYTYQFNETTLATTNQHIDNFTLQPNHMIKLGLSKNFDNDIQIGLFDSYFSAAHDNIKWNPNRQAVNPPSDSYHLVTMNLRLPLKLFSDKLTNEAYLTLYGYNLLDEAIYQPELAGRAINTNPLRAGRSFYLALDWSF